MSFKIRGLTAGALGVFKAVCEAWVEAHEAGDQARCDELRKSIEAQPAAPARDLALSYVSKKARVVAQPKPVVSEAPVKKTPIDTMRLAVNLLVLNRKPFADALLEGVQAGKLTEPMLVETKAACDAAVTALRAAKATPGAPVRSWPAAGPAS